MHTSYPDDHHALTRRIRDLYRELPGLVGGFGKLNRRTLTGGALSLKTKEPMALAVAIHARCLVYHLHDCLRAGAAREELLETVGVAVLMGGAPRWSPATRLREVEARRPGRSPPWDAPGFPGKSAWSSARRLRPGCAAGRGGTAGVPGSRHPSRHLQQT